MIIMRLYDDPQPYTRKDQLTPAHEAQLATEPSSLVHVPDTGSYYVLAWTYYNTKTGDREFNYRLVEPFLWSSFPPPQTVPDITEALKERKDTRLEL